MSGQLVRFALRQGPLRGLLQPPLAVDEAAATTSAVPPAAARGTAGQELPGGTAQLLATAGFPSGRADVTGVPGGDLLGHLLVAAFGLQRREPANPANDHRAVASVRSKFPVHVLVVGARGPARYLDVPRHALVDIGPGVPVPAALRPAPGEVRLVLAARYTDLPAFYGVLRSALAGLELGIAMRTALCAAAVLDLPARTELAGAAVAAAAALLDGTGPGHWSVPLLLTVGAAGDSLPSCPLEPVAAVPAGCDALLDPADPTLAEIAAVAGSRRGIAGARPRPAAAVPTGPTRGNWEDALWARSAGRVPAGLAGFSARPARRGEDCPADFLAWLTVPPPDDRLAEVARQVRVGVVLQGIAGRDAGHYVVRDGALECVRRDATLPAGLEQAFGYPLAADTDCGLRHALLSWYLSADLARLLDTAGPDAWPLVQLWAGWVAHGFCLAAAGQGLFARPARSVDEYRVAHLLDLPEAEVPVLMVVCGQSRYREPMLDLRIPPP